MIFGRELRKLFPVFAESLATLHYRSYASDGLITRRNADSLHLISPQKISYLSIDWNCAEPKMAAFRFLWPRLVQGAIVLLDDYANGPAYQRQKEAFDHLSRELNFPILTLPTGQGMIVK